MVFSRIPAATLVISLVATANPLAAANAGPGYASQEMLNSLLEISGVPGFGAAVWSGGKIVWTGSAGYRDIERELPVEPNTRFRLASVSKLLTVTAAAKLAEQGQVDLDASITDILPWLRNNWTPINMRQLAAHASGLPHYQAADNDRGDRHFATGREAVGNFVDRELLSPPGSAYSYSSWGYTLMGAVIEQVSGQHFVDFISKEITPGLSIGADATDSSGPDVSLAYEFVGGAATKAPPHDFSYTWGGGGMMANAESLAIFGGRMLANQIVSKETFDDMIAPFRLSSGDVAGEDDYAVGFGWRSSKDADGKPIVFHNGTAIGARSSLVLWRDRGVAATILSNASWVSSIDSTAQMLAAPFKAAPIGGGVPCPVNTARYEGRLGDVPVAGTARFEVVGGLCRAELSMSGELADYFNRGPQPDTSRLAIVGFDQQSGLSRAALVTPFGIYDLRPGEGASFASKISTSRSLELTFVT